MRGVDASNDRLLHQSVAACRTMHSVRPLLLLLLLAPALALAKSKGRSSHMRRESSINELDYNFSVDISAFTYKAMEETKQCTPLAEHTVQFLLSRVKLVFFYGDSISDSYELYLNDAPKLVNHERWEKNLPMAVYTFGWLGTPLNVNSHQIVKGLDPAGPLFYPTTFGCQDPLSSTDADHVTVLHTDWSRLGANEFTGPVDFMPHDGHRPQPGCNNLDIDTSPALGYTIACSHNRAVMLFANAISNSSSVVGTQCYSYAAFTNKLCQNNPKVYLIEPSEYEGVFYFTTKDSEPYGRGVEGT